MTDDGWVDGWIDGWMGTWMMDGWMDESVNGWIDVEIDDRFVFVCVLYTHIFHSLSTDNA